GALLAAGGIYLLVGVGLDVGQERLWRPVTQEALVQAQQAGQPVVLDFGATWCQKCNELEERTFSDARVRRALERIPHYKVDLTHAPGDGDVRKTLKDRYNVEGLPAVVFV